MKKITNEKTYEAKLAKATSALEKLGHTWTSFRFIMRGHNDRVIEAFQNGGRYSKDGKRLIKNGLKPNECVEGNKGLLKKRTAKLQDSIVRAEVIEEKKISKAEKDAIIEVLAYEGKAAF